MEEERRNLVLGALSLFDKVRITDLTKILDMDENVLREAIYSFGSESWFKDLGKLKGSFGGEEWRRASIPKPSPRVNTGTLGENDLFVLGYTIYYREFSLSSVSNILGLPNVNELRRIFFRLAGNGMISGTLAKNDLKVHRVVLPKANRVENLDREDRLVFGAIIANPVTKINELVKELDYSQDKQNEIRKRIWKIAALGCYVTGRSGENYTRTSSEADLYSSMSRVYPRPTAIDSLAKNIVSIISVRGETAKDGHSWLQTKDIGKELGFENERDFRKAVYQAVGKTQVLLMFDENKKRIFIPRDTPAILPTEEVKEEEVALIASKEIASPQVEEIVAPVPSGAPEEPLSSPSLSEEVSPSTALAEKAPQPQLGKVTALRGGEVVGDKYVFKVKIMNDSPYNITNVVVTLAAYPVDCLARASGSSELKRVNVVEAGGFVSPTFTLKPTKDCVKGTIKAIVNYVDYINELQTLKVEPHEISVVCGLLKPLIVDEKKFESSIKDWVRSGGNIQIKQMNPKVVFEKAQDVLTDNNFHIVACNEVPGDKEFVGVIKGFAEGKYSKKKMGVIIEIRGETDGEDTSVKVESSAEEVGMIAPTIQEVLEGFRKPRLFGKKAYYEKLGNQILQIAEDTSKDKGGIVSLADLHVAIINQEETRQTSVDSVEEAVNLLSKKGLIGGMRNLSSGIKIVEVKPIELSTELNTLLDVVSQSGVATSPELMQRTNWTAEAVKTSLERLELAGIAKRSVEGGVEKWYFPAFYKLAAKDTKQNEKSSTEGEEKPNEL